MSNLLNAQDEMTAIKPPKGSINLQAVSGKSVHLKVGQKAYWQFKQHTSVGFEGEASSTATDVLKIVKSHTQYHNKQVKGMTGGDAATVTLIFEALKKGSAQVKCQEIYRGEVKKTFEISVQVDQ